MSQQNTPIPDTVVPGPDRPIVQLESPFAGDNPQTRAMNVLYGRKAMRDALLRGESPFASHLLYAQQFVLDDDDPLQRRIGMEAGFSFLDVVDYAVVYTDRGISKGMAEGIERAKAKGLDIIERSLPDWAYPPAGTPGTDKKKDRR